jgi:hypothetical protein
MKMREALWTAAAKLPLLVRSQALMPQDMRDKSGSCCYRSPKCLRHSYFHSRDTEVTENKRKEKVRVNKLCDCNPASRKQKYYSL